MANIGVSSIKLIDSDGDALDDGAGRLNVNAYLNATPTIDIGDVSLLLGGTAADTNNGTAGAQTLRVTIASDTTGVLSIDDNGGSITIDNAALDYSASAVYAEDDAHSTGDRGMHVLSIKSSLNSSSAGTDGDYASLLTDGNGSLWVRESTNYTPDTFAIIDVDNASERLSDTIGVNNSCREMFFQADEANTGYVIVGDEDVADNRGMKLNPGDTLILDIKDTRSVYLWGSAANQNVRCMISTDDPV